MCVCVCVHNFLSFGRRAGDEKEPFACMRMSSFWCPIITFLTLYLSHSLIQYALKNTNFIIIGINIFSLFSHSFEMRCERCERWTSKGWGEKVTKISVMSLQPGATLSHLSIIILCGMRERFPIRSQGRLKWLLLLAASSAFISIDLEWDWKWNNF